MSVVDIDILSFGIFTLAPGSQHPVAFVWGGRIAPYQWCSLSTTVVDQDAGLPRIATFTDEGSYWDGNQKAYFAFGTLAAPSTNTEIVTCTVLVAAAVSPTPS